VNGSAPKVVVVVPTYNERDNLPVLAGQLAELDVQNLHLLVVDDNSPDGTGKIADELADGSADGWVSVLHRTVKDGLGRAYVDGMGRAIEAGADIVVQMDADLSHPASVIPEMVRLLESSDVGVVIGSRYVEGGSTASSWPWHRKALSAGANLYVNSVLRLHVKDATAGFKAWRADTLCAIELSSVRSNGYSFQVEMNYRTIKRGVRLAEVPIHFDERSAGSSKMSVWTQLESIAMPWRLLYSVK